MKAVLPLCWPVREVNARGDGFLGIIDIDNNPLDVHFTILLLDNDRHEGQRFHSLNFFSGRQAQRLSILCYLLALKLGLNRGDADLLRLVAPTRKIHHSLVPEQMTVKPGGAHTDGSDQPGPGEPGEFEIFKKSDDEIMKAAAIIARQRHEHWDGNGFPLGLQGEEIHIFARIAGLVSVFDSLIHGGFEGRPYDIAEVSARIRNHRGRRFAPRLVDILLKNLDEFLRVSSRYPD